MNLLLDFDGTLLNTRARLHRLFNHLVPQSRLTEDAYWEYKRAKTNHATMLATLFTYTPEAIKIFETEWLTAIEQPKWLALDEPYVGTTEHLAHLAQHCQLHLLTARQFPAMVEDQITRFGWHPYFTNLFVTGPARDKAATVTSLQLSPTDWLVGDTGHDILVGQKLGLRTAAVTNGFLSEESLTPYNPTILLPAFPAFNPLANHP